MKKLALALILFILLVPCAVVGATFFKIAGVEATGISKLGGAPAASIAEFPTDIDPPEPPAPAGLVATTELIDFVDMTAGESQTFLDECDAQNMTLVVLRIPSYSDFTDGQLSASYEAKCREIIGQADAMGIDVYLDLHTWYTTWDSYFDSSATNYATHRATYLSYITDALTEMAGDNVAGWFVLNEPQAQYATTSENNFIISCITTAKALTSDPVAVRFMGGYSPATGRYSMAIWQASDFVAINTYWDPGSPATSVYGVTETVMTNTIADATSLTKDMWVTEFGKPYSPSEEAQRAYVERFVTWAGGEDVAVIVGWASDPETAESYNLWSGYTPRPAFYELVNP